MHPTKWLPENIKSLPWWLRYTIIIPNCNKIYNLILLLFYPSSTCIDGDDIAILSFLFYLICIVVLLKGVLFIAKAIVNFLTCLSSMITQSYRYSIATLLYCKLYSLQIRLPRRNYSCSIAKANTTKHEQKLPVNTDGSHFLISCHHISVCILRVAV